MKLPTLALLLSALVCLSSGTAQPALVMGFSPSYIPNQSDHWQHEFNLNTYFNFPIWSHLEIGSRFMLIGYTSQQTARKLEPAYMVGPTLGWRQPVGEKVALALETGYMIGNLCTCGPNDPYPREGTSYWHLAGSINGKLQKPGWWGEVGFWIQNGFAEGIRDFYAHHL